VRDGIEFMMDETQKDFPVEYKNDKPTSKLGITTQRRASCGRCGVETPGIACSGMNS